MLNPILKIEWLKEGRTSRLPMTVIFYNAILAFITILFMFFNAESLQEGYSYDTASYLYQFLVISSYQIGSVFLIMPFSVWGYYTLDREKHMLEQFSMVPDFPRQFIIAKISLVISSHLLLYISSLPIIGLSCIYSGLGWGKVIRLGIMITIYAFWSGSIALFSFSGRKKGIWAFVENIFIGTGFLGGTLLIIEIIVKASTGISGNVELTPIVSNTCLLLTLLNPVSSYMGYYGSITGDSGIVNLFCSRIGVDTSVKTFSFLFYKIASLMCVLTGILFLALAIWRLEQSQKE